MLQDNKHSNQIYHQIRHGIPIYSPNLIQDSTRTILEKFTGQIYHLLQFLLFELTKK